MAIFEIFLGYFDYAETKKADDMLAPFFFTFINLVWVFILLNLIIAILADAYVRVKVSYAERYDENDDENRLEFFSSLGLYFTENCRRRKRGSYK